jgi:hypothetical protein
VNHKVKARNYKYDISDIKEKVKKNQLMSRKGEYWIPSTQPAMPWGALGVPLAKDPEGFINALYEPLRLSNPDYIKRTLLGKDTSGLHNVYRYELTPEGGYTNTIIVSAGTHGNEYTAEFALGRWYQLLVNDWEKYPQLGDIRKNTRVIIHPMINPWSFANNKRQNFRGVDLNRNMAYCWDYITGASFQVGGTYYKGTAPFSEKETQYMRDSFAEYSDAVAYVDFHTINTITAEHIVFTPRYRSQFRGIFNDTITRLYKAGNRIVNGTTAMPTIAVHAAVTHDMTTANPEWYNGLYGGNRDSVEMTEAIKWFGNVIIKASALEHKTTYLDETQPYSKVLIYEKGTTPLTLTSTTGIYNNIPHSMFDMTIKRHALLKVSGWIKVTTTAPTTFGLNVIPYQVNHPELGYSNVNAKNYNEIVQDLGIGTFLIPIHGRFPVFPNNHNTETTSRPEQVKFRMRAKSTGGVITYESWRVYLDIVPTERGKTLEIIDFTGKEASVEGSDYSVLFPDPSKFGIDSVTDE